MNNLLLILIILFAFFSIFMLLAWKQLKKIQNKIDQRERQHEKEVVLSYQREKLENEVYKANENLLATYVRFGDLNHLLIANTYSDIRVSRNVVDYSFFEGLGLDPTGLAVEDRFVTCLMPFNKQYNKIYSTIQNVCSINGCTCHRSDDKFLPNDILKYTMELILRSQVIVAVLDGRNANVYYEVGIAHSIGKTVILISNASKFKDTPFDVKGNRFILYQTQDDLNIQLNNTLKNLYYAK